MYSFFTTVTSQDKLFALLNEFKSRNKGAADVFICPLTLNKELPDELIYCPCRSAHQMSLQLTGSPCVRGFHVT